MPAEGVERDKSADVHAAAGLRHLIQTLDGFQVHQHVRADDPLFHHPEQIAAAAGKRRRPPVASRLLRERHRLLKITSIGIDKGFHASAPRILSRVIGRSFIRRPIALKIALATAATAGTLLDSPMLFAPYGP